jgi:hypothetical protein
MTKNRIEKKDFSFAVKKVLDVTIYRKTKKLYTVHDINTPKTFAKRMYNIGRSRAKLPLGFSTIQYMFPSIALIFIILLGLIFPPIEFTFFKSVYETTNPWFEKTIEAYFFLIGLWSFVLLSKEFTLKLWLQIIVVFVIQHLMFAIGYLRGFFD